MTMIFAERVLFLSHNADIPQGESPSHPIGWYQIQFPQHHAGTGTSRTGRFLIDCPCFHRKPLHQSRHDQWSQDDFASHCPVWLLEAICVGKERFLPVNGAHAR
jgi:hypothetical protein